MLSSATDIEWLEHLADIEDMTVDPHTADVMRFARRVATATLDIMRDEEAGGFSMADLVGAIPSALAHAAIVSAMQAKGPMSLKDSANLLALEASALVDELTTMATLIPRDSDFHSAYPVSDLTTPREA